MSLGTVRTGPEYLLNVDRSLVHRYRTIKQFNQSHRFDMCSSQVWLLFIRLWLALCIESRSNSECRVSVACQSRARHLNLFIGKKLRRVCSGSSGRDFFFRLARDCCVTERNGCAHPLLLIYGNAQNRLPNSTIGANKTSTDFVASHVSVTLSRCKEPDSRLNWKYMCVSGVRGRNLVLAPGNNRNDTRRV